MTSLEMKLAAMGERLRDRQRDAKEELAAERARFERGIRQRADRFWEEMDDRDCNLLTWPGGAR